MPTENPIVPEGLIDQLRYLADSPSYTAFHSQEERESVCRQCSGEFCNEKVQDAHLCMYETLSQAAAALSRSKEEIAQLRSQLEAYQKSGLEPCDYAAMKHTLDKIQQCEKDLSALMEYHQVVLSERDAALNDLHGKCSACIHYTPNHNEGPCRFCCFEIARDPTVEVNDNWKWRGVPIPSVSNAPKEEG